MTNETDGLIDWTVFGETRTLLGAGFMRILGYFREDGTKSVAAIEEAMRLKDSAKLVMPAHTLKGEAWQFGANRLALLAEEIEVDPFWRGAPLRTTQQIAIKSAGLGQ